jgi:hypothetical protein
MSFIEKFENFKNNLDLDINNMTSFFENAEECEIFEKILNALDAGSPEDDDGVTFSYLEGAKRGIHELIITEKESMEKLYSLLSDQHKATYFEDITTVMQSNYINVCLYIYQKHAKKNLAINEKILERLNEKYLRE